MKALILSVALILCAGVAQAADFQAFANVCDHGVQNVQVVRVQNVHQQRQQVVLVQNVRQRQRQQVVVVQNVRQRRNSNVVLVQQSDLIGVQANNQFGLFNIQVNR